MKKTGEERSKCLIGYCSIVYLVDHWAIAAVPCSFFCSDYYFVPSYILDIPRTFPNNLYYRENAGKDSLRPALRRVLLAFAIHNPNIGYCQVRQTRRDVSEMLHVKFPSKFIILCDQ